MLAPFVRQSRESLTQYAPALAAAFAIESSSGCFPLHALSCEHRQFQNPQSRHFSNSAAGHQRVQLHKLHNVEIDTIWESTVRVDLRSASLQAEYDPQGTMNAVTFHGPRNMRVSRRPIPVLQKPTVRHAHFHYILAYWQSGSHAMQKHTGLITHPAELREPIP